MFCNYEKFGSVGCIRMYHQVALGKVCVREKEIKRERYADMCAARINSGMYRQVGLGNMYCVCEKKRD